ncbi:MAG: hypothetical protein PHO34_00275 [Candidatus Omnitrophica bacterium]|nr:hypothetical protein [Candidatus Omnitrophota bacterium]MDD5500670.1 hypothetical protein [Candidatus Omnitrophota bacterium]
MIGKDKLLKQVEKLIQQEERLVPLLNRHVSSALFFSGLEQKERDGILDRFQEMAVKQREHVDILKGIKKEVSEGAGNVY